MQNKKIYFFGIEPMKMHCNFTYPTNAFYPKFCKIKNSRGYERNRKSLKILNYSIKNFNLT